MTTQDWRKDMERLKVKLAYQIHPTGVWAVQALWEDIEPDIISFIEKVEKDTRESTVREAAEIVAENHVKARKSYPSNSWDAGYHEALFDAENGVLALLPDQSNKTN